MNYHLIFTVPEFVSGASLDAGWLLLQTLVLWCISAAAILIAVKTQNRSRA